MPLNQLVIMDLSPRMIKSKPLNDVERKKISETFDGLVKTIKEYNFVIFTSSEIAIRKRGE